MDLIAPFLEQVERWAAHFHVLLGVVPTIGKLGVENRKPGNLGGIGSRKGYVEVGVVIFKLVQMGRNVCCDAVFSQTLDHEEVDVRFFCGRERTLLDLLCDELFAARLLHGARQSEEDILRRHEGEFPGERLDERRVGIGVDHFRGGKIPKDQRTRDTDKGLEKVGMAHGKGSFFRKFVAEVVEGKAQEGKRPQNSEER